jgi:hypothetical protein
MTSRYKHRVAALLALVIGLLTIIEGGIVLLGIETKPYPVLPWLLRYNVVMGFVSLGAGHGLWREQGWVGMHLLGMTVAVQSIGAMLFRTAIWTGINFISKK